MLLRAVWTPRPSGPITPNGMSDPVYAWVETGDGRKVYRRIRHANEQRSDLPCPMVIRDIEPYRSMADGSMITSRSQHRDHLRAHDMVELGNELPSGPSQEPVLNEQALAEAYDQCASGNVPKLPDRPPEAWSGPIEEND